MENPEDNETERKIYICLETSENLLGSVLENTIVLTTTFFFFRLIETSSF